MQRLFSHFKNEKKSTKDSSPQNTSINLFEGQSDFYPVGNQAEQGKEKVVVPGLFTCAALIVAYKEKENNETKIYIAHLPSGGLIGKGDDPRDKFQNELRQLKQKADPATIVSFYWSGSNDLSSNENNIREINSLLDLSKSETSILTGVQAVSVNLKEMKLIALRKEKVPEKVELAGKFQQKKLGLGGGSNE